MLNAETPQTGEPQVPEWKDIQPQSVSEEQQVVEQQMKEFADSLPTASPEDNIVPTKETK